MTVTHVGAGGGSAGTSSVAPSIHASTAAGDMMVMGVASKYVNASTPSGWTLLYSGNAGSGASGSDTGQAYLTVFYRVFVGGDGTPTVTVSGGNSAFARISSLRRTAGDGWDIDVVTGSRTIPATTWDVTMDADVDIEANRDYVFGTAAWNGDAASHSAPVLTSTGLVAGTGTSYGGTTTVGDDVYLVMYGWPPRGGKSSSAQTFQVTASTTTADHPTGPAVVIRARETVTPGDIALVANRGWQADASAGTTTLVDLPAGASITTGNYLIARVSVDNSGASGAAPGLTVTDTHSNSWTVLGPATWDPGAAGEGITAYLCYAKVTTGFSNGDDITFTWGASTTAKAVVVEEWSGIHATSPVAVSAVTDTDTGVGVVCDITPTASGQLVYTSLASEGDDDQAQTHDTDTTAGTWNSLLRLVTNGQGAAGVSLNGSWKLVTGTNAQSLLVASSSRDWAAVTVVFDAADDAVTGEAAVTLPSLTSAATGAARVTGAVAVTLPSLTSAATGGAEVAAVVSVTLPSFTSAVAGVAEWAGTISVALPSLSCSGSMFLTGRAGRATASRGPGRRATAGTTSKSARAVRRGSLV